MRAAVFKEKQRFVVEEIPTPSPGPGEIQIRVTQCAICGSDVHRFQHGMLYPGAVVGHEYCGVVSGLGEGVDQWAIGDRIIGGGGTPPVDAPSRPMREPRYSAKTFGIESKVLGAYAEYVTRPAWSVLPVPEGFTDDQAAMVEPCAVGVHTIRLSRIRLGDKVAVIGAGPIGLFCLQAAKAAGAAEVYVSEPVETRATAARQLGANVVIDPGKTDVVSGILDLTGGLGPDVVIECSADAGTLQQSLDMVRREGQVVVVSMAWADEPIQSVEWIGRQVELKAAYGSDPIDWRTSVDLMEKGQVQVEPMLGSDSHVPLAGIQDAFKNLIKPEGTAQLLVVL